MLRPLGRNCRRTLLTQLMDRFKGQIKRKEKIKPKREKLKKRRIDRRLVSKYLMNGSNRSPEESYHWFHNFDPPTSIYHQLWINNLWIKSHLLWNSIISLLSFLLFQIVFRILWRNKSIICEPSSCNRVSSPSIGLIGLESRIAQRQ